MLRSNWSVQNHGAWAAPAGADTAETDLDALLYLQGDDGGEGNWALAGAPMRLSLLHQGEAERRHEKRGADVDQGTWDRGTGQCVGHAPL